MVGPLERTLGYMSLLIEWPWLALVPAGLYGVLYRLSGRALTAGVAVLWGLYALYEYGMQRRWLDLLLLYPVLIIASATALVVGVRGMRHRAESRT